MAYMLARMELSSAVYWAQRVAARRGVAENVAGHLRVACEHIAMWQDVGRASDLEQAVGSLRTATIHARRATDREDITLALLHAHKAQVLLRFRLGSK